MTMLSHRIRGHRLAVLAALLLAACAPAAPPAPPEAPPFRPTASLQDIMNAQIDPSADFIWYSVGTFITTAGREDRQPRTEEEWEAVRLAALRLIEGGNLLMIEGRRVVAEGKEVADAHLEGISSGADIQAAIDANPAAFALYAQALQDATMSTMQAIEARDYDALLHSGETIDIACEACHSAYWYPGAVALEQGPAPLPAP